MELRSPKQLLIMLIYGLILVSFVGLIYFIFFYHAPTCTDGVQNGNEEEIDCRGAYRVYPGLDFQKVPPGPA
jgi:flagellar basal body-associated protein FliL